MNNQTNNPVTDAALKREANRLEKQPFQTMAKVVEPETMNQLKGWSEPRHAYILLEMPCFHALPGGDFKRGYTLTTMNVENRPEQIERFYYLTRKGARPLHFGNFPTHNDPNPERAKKAKYHTGPSGISPWQELAKVVRSQITRDSGNTDLREKAIGLEAKLAEARAELSAMKKKGSA